MRVAAKIAVGTGLTAVLLVGVLAYDLALVEKLALDNRELSEITLQTSMLPVELSRWLNEIEEFTRKHGVTGDPAYVAAVAERQRRFEAGLRELASLGLSSSERLAVGKLEAAWRTYTRRDLAAGDAGHVASVSPAIDPLQSLEDVRAQLAVVSREARAAVASQVARTTVAAERARRVSLYGALLAVAVGLLVLSLTVRSIHKPLKSLVKGTREVADGRFEYRLEATGRDEFAGLAASFNDMVRRLAEVDGMKEDFLAHVSHELKTPLVAMQETNELLLEEIAGPLTPKQRRLLELNLDGGRRLSSLISRILDLARMQAGVMEYEVRRHDLVEIVETAVAELAVKAGREHGRTIEVKAPEGPMPAMCDRDRIIQVVENLLDNALKHSPAGGVVVARLRRVEEPGPTPRLAVEVVDNGPGVPEAERRLIFEKFHQSGEARSTNSLRGVGLGLALAREVVEAHKGTIEVADNPEGGSVFRFVLPGAAPTGASERTRARRGRTAAGAAVAVLFTFLACASVGTVGDMYFESGRYREAVAAYESYLSTGSEDPERRSLTLYRLGVSYAVPGTPVHDPARSSSTLTRLLDVDPNGPYSVEARLLRDLQDETLAKRSLVDELRLEIAFLGDELDRLQGALATARSEKGEGEREVTELTDRIRGLRGEMSRLSGELEAAVEELERLKAIDLGSPPG